MDERYPGNSRRPSNQPPSGSENNPESEDKKRDPLVTGKVIRRKKPFGRRMYELFFAGEGGVVKYLARDVLIPAIRDTLVDLIIQGVDKAVDEVRPSTRTRNGYRVSSQPRTHISYDRQSIVRSPGSNPAPQRRTVPPSSSMQLDEIILGTHTEAELIVEKLYEEIEEYGQVTVAVLKDFLRETASYTDYKWGWTEGADFGIHRVREGFALVFPNPVVLR